LQRQRWSWQKFPIGKLGSNHCTVGLHHFVDRWQQTFSNQHLIIGVEPPVRLSDAIAGKVKPSSALHQIDERFYLLAEMPSSIEESNFSTKLVFDVFKDLIIETNFDIIIIDTVPGASEESLFYCDLADLALVVINDEPISILDAYALIKILMFFKANSEIAMIVNNVIDADDANEVGTKLNLAIERFLDSKIEKIGYVTYDRLVRRSIIRQELFVINQPDSEVSGQIRKIAHFFADKVFEKEIVK